MKLSEPISIDWREPVFVRFSLVILSELQALDPTINEVAFEGIVSKSEQFVITVSSIIPMTCPKIGWIKISTDDPLENVNSPNTPDSVDITSFEPNDHPSPTESVNTNLWTTGLTHIIFSVVDKPIYDSS